MQETLYKLYRCPNNDSVADHEGRCKRCGEWLLYAGEKTEQEMDEYNEQLTLNSI